LNVRAAAPSDSRPLIDDTSAELFTSTSEFRVRVPTTAGLAVAAVCTTARSG
jgi:hypothetical protein